MIFLIILAMSVASVLSSTMAQSAEQAVACPYPEGWKPADLPGILAEHTKWVERADFSREPTEEAFSQGRANLCNANLRGAQLNKANLALANLSDANLRGAQLNKANLQLANLALANLSDANLRGAQLNKANLALANLSEADLLRAQLTEANLLGAQLNKTYLGGAQLNKANLQLAGLTNANLGEAQLTEADLLGARLTEAYLGEAQLNKANLRGAQLNKANLRGAQLTNASLVRAQVDMASLAYTNVTGAIYAPASPPPDPHVAGITGLQTVTFPKGEEIGLVQLRELIQKAGLRDLEREATYALERGRTWHALVEWKADPVHAAEGVFRFIFFEATTDYGLHPARALILIIGLWAALTMVYIWPIRLRSKRIRVNEVYRSRQTDMTSGIYRIWPKDRIEARSRDIAADHPIKIERLQGSTWTALGWAAYFSLLAAFHIGFREFNVGTWLSRLQAHEYALKPIGWVRVLSGAQSLISVYMLAIWALTYFGRPFQ